MNNNVMFKEIVTSLLSCYGIRSIKILADIEARLKDIEIKPNITQRIVS